jgi:CRP-like cAMP-binding protein
MNVTPLSHPQALASMELFTGLPFAALDEVMATGRLRRVPKETRIFNQGDHAERAYALIEGSVRISQSDSDGDQVVLRFIGPGEMFGTLALFTDQLYPAEATAITDTVEISWSKTELFRLMGHQPQIAMNVLKIVGLRLKEAQERLRELSTQRAERRVAHAVLRLAHQAGQTTAEGTMIEFPLRRKDVANISGTTLHTASRILTAWEKAGLLVSNSQRVTIRKRSAIQRIADDRAD